MTTDVVDKAISGNAVKNGHALTYVDQSGNKASYDPGVTKIPSINAIEAELTNKFDDPRYYSGDTAN